MSQDDPKKYDFIDALRGIAILGVVLVHSSQAILPNSNALRLLMQEGARGVQLFFVVSAVTLCMSWVARSRNEQKTIRNFYIRRFFRIAPMFYIAIIFYFFFNGVSPSHWSPNGIRWWFVPMTAAFLHGFHPETITSVVPGGWSIAIEMSFYSILPFLLYHIKSINSSILCLFISMLFYGINKIAVSYFFSYPENQRYLVDAFSFLNLFGQLPIFIMGILCYFFLSNSYPRKRILCVIVIGATIFIALLLASYYRIFLMPRHFIFGGLFSILLIYLANWPSILMVNKITTTLGKISYSMYLTHFAVLTIFSRLGLSEYFLETDLFSILHFICIVVITTIISLVFFNLIEKPGILLGKRIIEKLY